MRHDICPPAKKKQKKPTRLFVGLIAHCSFAGGCDDAASSFNVLLVRAAGFSHNASRGNVHFPPLFSLKATRWASISDSDRIREHKHTNTHVGFFLLFIHFVLIW